MHPKLLKILDDAGITIGVKGTKEKRLTNALAADLIKSPDSEKKPILTKHGARMVLQAARRNISYKEMLAIVLIEADDILVAERQKDRKELAAVLAGQKLLEMGIDDNDLDDNNDEVVEGNDQETAES